MPDKPLIHRSIEAVQDAVFLVAPIDYGWFHRRMAAGRHHHGLPRDATATCFMCPVFRSDIHL
jgi:hypothetical protein